MSGSTYNLYSAAKTLFLILSPEALQICICCDRIVRI